MRAKIGLFLLLLLGGALLGLTAALLVLRDGFSAREEPSRVEAFLARRMRQAAMPIGASELRNPIAPSAEVLAEARAHFADHCAQCHGNDGKGRTEMGRNLYPKAPDMTAGPTQSLSDGQIFSIIKNGIRLSGMPAWGEDTPEADRDTWTLVHFIRHLPRITQEELAEMESLNPRSAAELAQEEAERRFLAGEDVPPPAHHHH